MLKKTPLLGTVLMIVGFVLTPFIIGIPIILIGWLILIYTSSNSFIQKLKFFIPQSYQDQIKSKIADSYMPYQPAAKSLSSLVLQLLLYTGLIFGLLLVIYYYFFIKPKL